MGIELDVLVGHPDYELLFLASQASYAAGLPQAKDNVTKYIHRNKPVALKLGDIVGADKKSSLNLPARKDTRNWSSLWLMPESSLYTMLLRGNSTQTEPFRKWVTEEVLPSIRKTGKYDAAESQNPIAQGVMDELKALRGEVVELKEIIRELIQRPQQEALALPAPVSPYEGDRKATLSA